MDGTQEVTPTYDKKNNTITGLNVGDKVKVTIVVTKTFLNRGSSGTLSSNYKLKSQKVELIKGENPVDYPTLIPNMISWIGGGEEPEFENVSDESHIPSSSLNVRSSLTEKNRGIYTLPRTTGSKIRKAYNKTLKKRLVE